MIWRVSCAPQTLEEYLVANTDLCFEFAPGAAPPKGEDDYSNFGFGILQHIAEHVSGKSFAAPLGIGSAHGESLLSAFNKDKLGFTSGNESKFGIYFSQPLLGGARDEKEVGYRAWRDGSMMGSAWDTKRPWCAWMNTNEVGCGLYMLGMHMQSFHWQHEKVPVSYENEGFAPGPGLLAAEMPLLQKFMAHYWVSGDEVSNYYGRERATNPSTRSRSHLGGLAGTISTVAQFMGDSVEFTPVPRKDGELNLAILSDETPKASCKLPSGLNLAMAANQSSDSSCNEDGCGWRYRALREVVKEALCDVDWLKVTPQLTNK